MNKLITDDRNSQVMKIMNSLFKDAEEKKYTIKEEFQEDLLKIFSTHIWGYREITLVVVIATIMNSKYRASENLYACSPRSLYEVSIRPILIDRGIPNRKSGPLNIAKGIKQLDQNWAAGKQDVDIANSVLNLVSYIEASSLSELRNFAICLHAKFLDVASATKELKIELQIQNDAKKIYEVCKMAINKVPDQGNTAQKICGLLLYSYHEKYQTGIVVTGFEDRASTTSTTSHKPGDVNEEKDEDIKKVYEITTKKFDLQRMRESYETLKHFEEKTGKHINEIIVLCTKENYPELIDSSTVEGVMGRVIYQDVIYYFINIFEWIYLQIIKMDRVGREFFYEQLNNYIDEVDTNENLKILWKKIHT